jgi:hypothetical protein
MSAVVRIDHIFVHTFRQEKRLFACVSGTNEKAARDVVLNLPLMRMSGKSFIIGLPAIEHKKLYVVIAPSDVPAVPGAETPTIEDTGTVMEEGQSAATETEAEADEGVEVIEEGAEPDLLLVTWSVQYL